TAVTTAVKVALTARLPGAGTAQLSFCDPTAPLTVQPVVEVAQVTPPPAGSGSSTRVTPVAVPGPRLVTTMVNVAVSPAVIVPLSGVLAIASTGVWQPIWPGSDTDTAFVALAVAVLSIDAQALTLVAAV